MKFTTMDVLSHLDNVWLIHSPLLVGGVHRLKAWEGTERKLLIRRIDPDEEDDA